MTIAAVFIASLALTMISVPKAYAENIVKVINPLDATANFGPYGPGDSFDADIVVDEVFNLHAFEFKLSWNPSILRLNSEVPVSEGPFLPSGGGTFFVKSIGVDQGSVNVADLLMTGGYTVEGTDGVLATAHFNVIGGGSCDLTLTAELYDAEWGAMGATTEGGTFFSAIPFIDFKYFVPVPVPTGDFVSVTGMGHYNALDASGNPATYMTEPYTTMRPVLYPDNTGSIENVELVPGTMFFGDKILFDASGSYDYNNDGDLVALPNSAYHWVIRAGGVDTIKGNDVRYESGVELPTGPTFTYIFPGALPYAYTSYASFHLGWFDLTLTVTDSDGNVATYSTWIRIFRIAGDQIKSVHIPNKHVHKGETMLIGEKTQNLIGTGRWGPFWLMEDPSSGQIALGRMINSFIWTSAKFTITDAAGNKIATLYAPAVYMTGTETPTDPVYATWTVPTNLPAGMYTVTAKAVYCGTGNGYGLTGSGIVDSWFEVLP
jgi:hypothetical protein